MIEELSKLPDVSFIGDVTLESIEKEMLTDYADRYKELTGDEAVTDRADPAMLILYASAVQLYQMFLYVDKAGKLNLLKYAYGDYLDNLAAMKGITREAAKPSECTVRFTLSAAQASAISIPAGTRVTNGVLYFTTNEYKEIASGSTYIDVACTCMTSGSDGNSLAAGTINILVDPIPYVASVSNTDATDGGTDAETDDSLAGRVFISPSKYSTAGPEDSYIYWAKSYNSSISDVLIKNETPGEVKVIVVMADGELPSQTILDGLAEYLQDENVRPLTDHVTTAAPDTVEYAIDLKYYINSSDSSTSVSIQNAVSSAVSAYISWQHEKLGRDINPSELIKRIITAGAKRVELTSPVFTSVPAGSVAKLTTQTVTYGGIEND
jgi:phage-related baseplate assembly protein